MLRRERLDTLLVDRGLVESRTKAQRLVMAGQVRVNAEIELKASRRVPIDSRIEIEHMPRYVSRGGYKLEAALADFGIRVRDRVCADVGASTGGFADCLLQNGASRVYAIDVGHGILHWRLRQDPRVVVMERTNARYLRHLPEPVSLVTLDVSFISLRHILPVVRGWLEAEGDVIALIKPQFEAGRQAVGRGGVVRDPSIHRQVVSDLLAHAVQSGFSPRGLLPSPILGPKGNKEFLLWLGPGGPSARTDDLLGQVFPDLKQGD